MIKTDKKSKRFLIYGGTTEGRTLAGYLCGAGFLCTVCVATEYGEMLMESMSGLSLRQGRMNAAEMKAFAVSEDFLAVVDATHPFATEVSKQIKESLQDRSIPYIRLKRKNASDRGKDSAFRFPDAESCAESLVQTEGNILLTTGSKDLPLFCKEELRDRLFVRILPNRESLSKCEEQGIRGRQMIAMQGPFSVEMNEAMIRDFHITILVTKESGTVGGYPEKIQAAEQTGILTYIIGNPEKEGKGFTFEETISTLCQIAGSPLPMTRKQISLIGMGMGREGLLTQEAKEALEQAEVVFGSERMLQRIGKEKERYPFYLAEDIMRTITENFTAGKDAVKIAVLFSGDTGFYSGAKKLYQKLKEKENELNCEVRMFPGISSMSYLAAAAGISLNDTVIASIHGRKTNLVNTVMKSRKTFLLVSGANDLRQLGEMFLAKGLSHLLFVVGYQLSYPEEEVTTIPVSECSRLEKEGLYCCFILNEKRKAWKLTHGRKDSSFIRCNLPSVSIPMTKEEIREISICKLELRDDSILYDIGSGTGSVAVECALLSENITVYAIEKKKDAAELIHENCGKFGVTNVEVMEAHAPEGLSELPVPSHAFIGGSGGNIKEILWVLYKKNPCMRVVINAITLETIGSMAEILKVFPAEQEEVVQVQVSRSQKAGGYHLMKAENAVFILSFTFVPEKQEDTCRYQES